MYQTRIRKLLDAISAEAAYITSPQNRYYFSGFTGTSATLVLSPKGLYLFTDSRYRVQAAQQAKDFTICDITDGSLWNLLDGFSSLAIEEAFCTVRDFHRLRDKLGSTALCDCSADIGQLRAVKDAQELSHIRTAAEIADRGFAHILPQLTPGKTERELALALEFFMREQGAEALSFETILASGERSAMPHGTASDKVLAEGELVTLDFGCKFAGYCSDMTRTVALGQIDDRARDIYETVRAAQQAALDAIRPGAACRDVDKAARDVIAAQGYGEHFGHALGHSLGLDIHESPNCSPRSEDTLAPGMLMTAEPGIYLDGICGVRIEDLVAVTADGYENFTTSPKELLVL